MTQSSTASVRDVTVMFSHLLPIKRDQEVVFGQLIRSIAQCERLGSDAWSVTLLKDGFRLNVGRVHALLVTARPGTPKGASQPGADRVFVDVQMLLAGRSTPELASSLAGGSCIEPVAVRAIGEPLWRYSGRLLASSEFGADPSEPALSRDLRLIAPAHARLLDLAAHTSRGSLRRQSGTLGHNCYALYRYAWNVCGVRQSRAAGIEGDPRAAQSSPDRQNHAQARG